MFKSHDRRMSVIRNIVYTPIEIMFEAPFKEPHQIQIVRRTPRVRIAQFNFHSLERARAELTSGSCSDDRHHRARDFILSLSCASFSRGFGLKPPDRSEPTQWVSDEMTSAPIKKIQRRLSDYTSTY